MNSSGWKYPLRIIYECETVIQVILIISGNLSFLNWLTLIPAFLCFDDKTLSCLFPSTTRQRVIELQEHWKYTTTKPFSEPSKSLCLKLHTCAPTYDLPLIYSPSARK